MDPSAFVKFKLIKKEKINYNTALFRFALPDEKATLGLPVASCILIRFVTAEGKTVIRPYTPTSDETAIGYFDLVVKTYENGTASKHIHSLEVGDELEVKGPIQKLQFTPNKFKHIGMVAGGTGITPIIQVFRKILSDPTDSTKLSLIFANNTEEDIFLKEIIDAFVTAHPDRVKVHYKVAKPTNLPVAWTGGVGFVTKEDLVEHLPAASEGNDIVIGVCGPPGMMAVISGDKLPDKSQGPLDGYLKELGYTSENVFKF
ncbi:ferredoxin reductase-like protein [Ramicandelaber brevisporus]|nr:ferredoxin reductase-like protein [Ramicandelaber brevisporus]